MAQRQRHKEAVQTAADGGRDAITGRFIAGNKAAVGNVYAKQIAQYRKALHDAISPIAVAAIARAMIKAARGGDVAAAKLVLGYAIGAPTVEVSVRDPIAVNVQTMSDSEIETRLAAIGFVRREGDE